MRKAQFPAHQVLSGCAALLELLRTTSSNAFALRQSLFWVTMQNILESQVTDLTHLADSPIAIHDGFDMNSQHRQSSSAESPARDNGKRKSEDTQNGNIHTRAKRNRYISIAWYA